MFSHEKAHLSPQMSEKQFASEPVLLLRVMNPNGSNHALLGIPQITTMLLVMASISDLFLVARKPAFGVSDQV